MKNRTTGKQICGIADLLFALECVAVVLAGLFSYNTFHPIVGILVIAIGCYCAWAVTRFMVGFGELVDDTAANRELNERMLEILEAQYGAQHIESVDPSSCKSWSCKKCGYVSLIYPGQDVCYCEKCGAQFFEEK